MKHSALAVSLCASLACGVPAPGAAEKAAKPAAKPAARDAAPPPFEYPAPVTGHFEDADQGAFDLVDGIAYPSRDEAGTVVYTTSKAIASPALAGSDCPMTRARALTVLRNARFVEVTVDGSGARSAYFGIGSPYAGQGREQDVDGRYWKIAASRFEGRISGTVTYHGKGELKFDLPISKPAVNEVSEGDRVADNRVDTTRRAPTERELLATYAAIRNAALAKDLKAMLAAQGFDAQQIGAIQGLPGIEADLQAHKDRFLTPGAPEEPRVSPGEGGVLGGGTNSRGEGYKNWYQFAPCGDALVLIGIGENPQ